MENVTDKVSFKQRHEQLIDFIGPGSNVHYENLNDFIAPWIEQAYIAGLNRLSIISSQTTILDRCDVGASHVLLTNYLKDKGFIR